MVFPFSRPCSLPPLLLLFLPFPSLFLYLSFTFPPFFLGVCLAKCHGFPLLPSLPSSSPPSPFPCPSLFLQFSSILPWGLPRQLSWLSPSPVLALSVPSFSFSFLFLPFPSLFLYFFFTFPPFFLGVCLAQSHCFPLFLSFPPSDQ